MTLPYRKKLIEVALPLKAINEASAKEKSIRHGHPSTLHLWWARRPLAACRAVLFASLVDDPDSDPAFQKPDGTPDQEMAGSKRAKLFNLIEELVQWDNSNNPNILHSARAEIARCVASHLIETGKMKSGTVIADGVKTKDLVTKGHCRPVSLGMDKKAGRVCFSFETKDLPPFEVINSFLAEHAPPVLDPFCGGGSIPLEAQRLGLRAYASDLNPVPVLITKALIEIPPKFADLPPVNPDWQSKYVAQKALTNWQGAQGLAEDVRYYGNWMRNEAEKRLGHLYPKVKIAVEVTEKRPELSRYIGQELSVIAWLWARTVECPNPACKAWMPLVKSFWLSKRDGRKVWIEPISINGQPRIRFEIRSGSGTPQAGTVSRKGARCVCCGTSVPLEYIRSQGKAGRMGKQLMAIVCDASGGRTYLPSVADHAEVESVIRPSWIPDAEMARNPFALRPPLYGLKTFGDLFTKRQLVTLDTLCSLIGPVCERIMNDASHPDKGGRQSQKDKDHSKAYGIAVATYLALGISRLTDICNALCMWENTKTQVRHVFTRQAIPMIWDFAEPNVFGEAAGDFGVSLGTLSKVIERLVGTVGGVARIANATEATVEVSSSAIISTDPPYYNNIDYEDLSDFFYVWLRHCLAEVYPSLFATLLTPKALELVATPYRFDDSKVRAREHFLTGLSRAFERMRATQSIDYPMTVYYAFKQAESDDEEDGEEDESAGSETVASTGWETMLEGLIEAGFSITGTWPMRTELSNRPMANRMNSLASSIVIVCRPRTVGASIATRKQFMNDLRQDLPEALRDLQQGNVAPVDMAQSAIGPGMAVFTRYAKVIESDGKPMTVRTALGIINQVLDEVLAEQEGEFDSDTRWALAWFEQYGMKEESFGIAETLSRAKNTAVNGLVDAGIIKAKSGKVQLVSRSELPEDWNPATDERLTVWETAQHLIRLLDSKGEIQAAELLNRLGGLSETARDLAYRLYSICERKKWADEALAYNSLVIAWPELTKLALSGKTRQSSTTPDLFS